MTYSAHKILGSILARSPALVRVGLQVVLVLSLFSLTARAAVQHPKSMVIFTGHEQIPLQAEIFRGFSDEQYVIGTEDFRHFSHEVYIERVDAFRDLELVDYDLLASEIYQKYDHLPRLIVAEGNAAQRLARRIAQMTDEPIDILAVNTSQDALPGYSKAELFSIPKSLETISAVMPQLDTLYVIAPASRAVEITDLWEFDYSDHFDLQVLDETLSIDTIVETISNAEPNSAVFWVGRSAHLLATEGLPIRIIKQLADLAVMPVFGMHSSLHKAGGAGGFVTNAETLGRSIARMAHGLGAPSVALISAVQFDYNQVERWGFELDSLTGAVTLFNEPQLGLSEAQLFQLTTAAATAGLLIFGFIGAQELKGRRQRLRQQAEIERINTQFHRALTMSNMVLFEENVSTGEAEFIVRPSSDEGDKPYVGNQRIAATLPEYRMQIEVALSKIGETVDFPLTLPNWDAPKWVRNQVLDEYKDEKGNLIRIQVSQDITEAYEAQQSLEAAYKKTALSLKQLEAASEKQKQLFAVVGHELRTPAASLNMMLEAQESEGSTAYAQDIRATATHLLGVLDDLRAVVEPGLLRARSSSRARPFEVVERSVTPLREMLAQRGIRISLEADARAGEYCTFDQRGLRQVMTNLVKNAAIHSGATSIKVGVGLNRDSSSTTTEVLRISVHDNGKGVEPTLREKIFEAFERADATADGTGLGLHICREIIQANGGRLWVDESKASGGAVFEIELPILESSDIETATEAKDISIGGKRLLIVEDNLMLRKLTDNIVRGLDAECQLAENGRQALDVLSSTDFDLIVTDIFMPELDGYGLVEAIRSRDKLVPIIGVTAATVGDETDRLLAVGADMVISKPITKEGLKSAWAELAKQGRIRA